MGGLQQAGNILRIEAEGPWMTEIRHMWEGTPTEKLIRKDFTDENGEECPHADRRQDLVFIGIGLKHEAIQKTLDQCLLNDQEMAMGPEKWEESMASTDKIQLSLDDENYDPFATGSSDEEEYDEGSEQDEESGDDLKKPQKDVEEATPAKRLKRYEVLSSDNKVTMKLRELTFSFQRREDFRIQWKQF